MAHAYTPGLEVSANTRVTRVRELPLAGRALVKPGDRVTAKQPVLAAELPGELDIVRLADRLGLDPEAVKGGLKVQPGDNVQQGAELCTIKTFFGLFTSTVASPTEGVIEFFTESNAHLGIRRPPNPFTILAYIDGTVVEIDPERSVTIESDAAMIQGIFGVGGERLGTLLPLSVPANATVSANDLEQVHAPLAGAVLVGGATFCSDALDYAAAHGVSAVVTGSIDAPALARYVGHEIGVSITGDEDVPFSLIITEGFGALPIADRVVDLARQFAGRAASVNGATQVRAGAVRPEVIIPHDGTSAAAAAHSSADLSLRVGSRVRIIRVPYFGAIGTVSSLPHKPTVIPTGAEVRVLTVELTTGEAVTVPRANVELLA